MHLNPRWPPLLVHCAVSLITAESFLDSKNCGVNCMTRPFETLSIKMLNLIYNQLIHCTGDDESRIYNCLEAESLEIRPVETNFKDKNQT